MARIFTITEGVENMGTLKTGGQGSVYKARRTGEIITAIKILPTPISSESADDKNFVSFQNEVEKLKKVNEDANPNVVTIIRSGITDSGNFPFIEMEYIDGPDLEDLLKPPHDPVFTIAETLKAATHLANALAHCHRADVKHGDLKSNNVKFNRHTGNYILLDFGLSLMSDEQRRTSLRQAGAIEFMAPEQHEGTMLFATEVYSFGIILFELLCGQVPFPLSDSGESARNAVLVAHLDTPPPNLLSLREQHLPAAWSADKKESEMRVPEWLVSMVYKCLAKDPAQRFADGMALHEYIVRNSIMAAGNVEWGAARIARLEQEHERLQASYKELQQKLLESDKRNGPRPARSGRAVAIFKNMLIGLLVLALAAIGAERLLPKKNPARQVSKQRAARAENAFALSEEERSELNRAKRLFSDGRVEESRAAFKALAELEIPEAMFEYGNLTLLNIKSRTDCNEAVELLKKAASRGWVPAMRTVGFLYAFAGDSLTLQQRGYQGCDYNYDIPRGSRFLMQATLQGDTVASRLLDKLNNNFGSH